MILLQLSSHRVSSSPPSPPVLQFSPFFLSFSFESVICFTEPLDTGKHDGEQHRHPEAFLSYGAHGLFELEEQVVLDAVTLRGESEL